MSHLADNLIPAGFLAPSGTNLRMLVSARQQVGDVNSDGWIERLNWKGTRVHSGELPKLNPTAVRALLKAGGQSTNILAERSDVVHPALPIVRRRTATLTVVHRKPFGNKERIHSIKRGGPRPRPAWLRLVFP